MADSVSPEKLPEGPPEPDKSTPLASTLPDGVALFPGPSSPREIPLVTSLNSPIAPAVAEVIVQSGRRRSDWQIVQSNGRSIFYWMFGMFLDERHKPSMSRIMLAMWTVAGWRMIDHELWLKSGDISLSNATWSAWWVAEGMLALAVFGPSIASFFGPGAAGAVTGMGASIRDAVTKAKEVIKDKL